MDTRGYCMDCCCLPLSLWTHSCFLFCTVFSCAITGLPLLYRCPDGSVCTGFLFSWSVVSLYPCPSESAPFPPRSTGRWRARTTGGDGMVGSRVEALREKVFPVPEVAPQECGGRAAVWLLFNPCRRLTFLFQALSTLPLLCTSVLLFSLPAPSAGANPRDARNSQGGNNSKDQNSHKSLALACGPRCRHATPSDDQNPPRDLQWAACPHSSFPQPTRLPL